ncbi:MAG: TatD family hydrolase [Candidatus Hydrogenedentes bacterium]|jgi:TatD DNase family protein|nr:TatD family hydrolase [Candidatus Hydrogenedentota bacterium]
MKGVDTHCHLQMTAFDEDREEVLRRALDGLAFLIVIGNGAQACRDALAFLQPRVYAALGYHPYQAEQCDGAALAQLEAWAATSGVVAIGEAGLDYHHIVADPQTQRKAFEQQAALAVKTGLPLVVHSRDAQEDSYAVLKEYVPQLSACIMHCFGGDAAFAEKCLELGCYISFAGNVTFPKAQLLHESLAVVPLHRLLAETDAPYLAPQPVRGKRCEPIHVLHTLRFMASRKGISLEEMEGLVVENACRAFKIEGLPAEALQ